MERDVKKFTELTEYERSDTGIKPCFYKGIIVNFHQILFDDLN
jgi:hypothetical protein